MIPIVGATLSLTQNCNLRCDYCFTHGKSNRTMDFETAKKCVDFLLRQAHEANINKLPMKKRQISVTFWGGEPLLEWELIQKIVDYAENSEFRDVIVNFSMTTNGTLLTPDKFNFSRQHQIGYMVSLDGTQKTHDWYRKVHSGEGSHLSIMRNMEKVTKYFPNIKVRMSPYPEAIHRFYEDVRYLAQHGMMNIMFSPVYESNWNEEHWKIWEEEMMKVVDLILYLRQRTVNLQIEHFKSFMHEPQRYPCGAGRWFVGFDVDGSMYPCHRFAKTPDTRPWREKEMCIGHAYEGVTRPEVVDKFVNWNPECGKCQDCAMISYTPCAGGCYAINYDLSGNICKPPQALCRYTKLQKKISEYLKVCLQNERQDMVDLLNKTFGGQEKQSTILH